MIGSPTTSLFCEIADNVEINRRKVKTHFITNVENL
jgi:hypothetical protein